MTSPPARLTFLLPLTPHRTRATLNPNGGCLHSGASIPAGSISPAAQWFVVRRNRRGRVPYRAYLYFLLRLARNERAQRWAGPNGPVRRRNRHPHGALGGEHPLLNEEKY